MGVNLRELVAPAPIALQELTGRIIAIDGYNALYQFLAIIRQPDGSLLMDSQGRVTSHLSGVFYRTANLIEAGIKPVYVFDGKPPELKSEEIKRRTEAKLEAAREYRAALERGDMVSARKAAQATSRLTREMVDQARRVLDALGIPCVQAPSEGEAQAAFMNKKGDAWATVSQDYDALLFGGPRLVRNLTISGRRKLPGKPVYVDLEPEIVRLEEVMKELKVSRAQLIDVGILLGTDFNPDGFRGIGPKKAYKMIQEYGSLRKAVEEKQLEVDPALDMGAITEIFMNPQTTGEYRLSWGQVDGAKLKEILAEDFDFSPERIEAAVGRMEKARKEQGRQSNLERWF